MSVRDRASTVLLLFQFKFMSFPLSMCHSLLPLHPSLCVFCFHHSFSLCFSILYFISVYATHIVLLPSSCTHYFHSTACTYKPLFSLYHSTYPAPFLLFFPGFVVPINIFLCLVLHPLFLFNFVSLLNFIPFITYLPFLFYFCPILLDLLSPVPSLYPFLGSFLLSHCPMPPHLCQLCNVCTTSIYPLPYSSCCPSCFIRG